MPVHWCRHGRDVQESAGIKEKTRRAKSVGVVKNETARTQVAVETRSGGGFLSLSPLGRGEDFFCLFGWPMLN